MAVIFACDDPANLLSSFREGIDQGHIETWSYDEDGDFTHTAEQWENEAWFRPEINEGNVKFSIVAPVGTQLTKEVYALYHGRLAESFLAHCDELFSGCGITAMPIPGDMIDGL